MPWIVKKLWCKMSKLILISAIFIPINDLSLSFMIKLYLH